MKPEKRNDYLNTDEANPNEPISLEAQRVGAQKEAITREISTELEPPSGGPNPRQRGKTKRMPFSKPQERQQERIQEQPPEQAKAARRKESGPSKEHIADRIEALGNPQHPNHQTAIDDLVAIGTPAVPLLSESLAPQKPWLQAYRAAEALSRIRDGGASGALLQALRHPNSNVRWGAVRALAQVGDFRALLELRRVAHEDHGRTSWGESVSGAAQSALDQIQSQSVWHQSIELIKTAFTSILMILSLILAFSVVNTLQDEVSSMGQTTPVQLVPGPYVFPTTSTWGSPTAGSEPKAIGSETGEGDEENLTAVIPTPPPPTVAPTPTAVQEEIPGRAVSAANIRPEPSVRNEPIGAISQGDEIIFLSMSDDGMWYRIRLGNSHADSSRIDNTDGSKSGWVHRELVSQPREKLPVEEPTE